MHVRENLRLCAKGDEGMNLSDETIQAVEKFNFAMANIERDYSLIRESLSSVNEEQQDLLHELELSPLAADERSLTANKLIEVRKRRRQLANDFAIIEPLVRFKKGHETLGIPLAKLLRDMQKIREALATRQYTPRIRTDIKLYKGELSREEVAE